YVVPADDKPFARVAAAAVILNALLEIDPRFPRVSREARQALQTAKVDLESQAPKGARPDPNVAEAEEAGGAAGGKDKKRKSKAS
ncbi:MAG TPA: polyphosphate kinase 2 family protein, partial [Candidatus Binatia bacterium]|nr:polyphosphate kinase 2 family protein [Candidatus Binatia bacterium]